VRLVKSRIASDVVQGVFVTAPVRPAGNTRDDAGGQ